jgi:hypothetical protein
MEKLDYDKKSQAKDRLYTRIQETVHANHLIYTFNYTIVYAMLTNLKS